MTHSHWQLVVLDLAGTTIRDGGMIERAVAAAVNAAEPGRTVTAQEVAASRGLPKNELFSALFPGRPADATHALATFNDRLLTLAAAGPIPTSSCPPQCARTSTTSGESPSAATPPTTSPPRPEPGRAQLSECSPAHTTGPASRPRHTHLLTSVRELPTALRQAIPATAGMPE